MSPPRALLTLAALALLPACQGEPLVACNVAGAGASCGCPGTGLCALSPTVVVEGTLSASINPIPGATVVLTAYSDSCGGTPTLVLPSPAEAITDSAGHYRIPVQPTQAAAAACLRVAYGALISDTTGVRLRLPPATPDTLHIDLVGP